MQIILIYCGIGFLLGMLFALFLFFLGVWPFRRPDYSYVMGIQYAKSKLMGVANRFKSNGRKDIYKLLSGISNDL